MKKYLALMSLTLSLALSACSPSTPAVQTDTDAHYKATLQITTKEKTSSKEVTFEQGDSVMDVLEDHHKVEDEGGMVTSIDGVSQDPAKKTYWLYKINGEMAQKGAEEQQLADGDSVEFYLETFE